MHFEPGLTPKYDAVTSGPHGADRQSRIEFGPGAFNHGFEWLVSIVAHELEHVAQNLIGDYRERSPAPGDFPVAEFLASSGSVLQVASTRGRSGRGLLGEIRAPSRASALPPLPPEQLAKVAADALSKWLAMSGEEQQRYWPQFEGTRDKLLERMTNDAPPALRPPTSDQSSPEFAQWRDGVPSVYDPLSPEYDPDVAKSPWSKVKDQWKRFDAVKSPRPAAAKTKEPIGGVVP